MKRARRSTKAPKQPSTQANLGVTLEELRELEEKAMRLEKLAKMLLNTPQQAFYIYDYRKESFFLGQEHVSGLYGYEAGEIEKRKGGWFSIIHPEDLEAFTAAHRRTLENPVDDVHNVRARILRKKGGYEWIEAYMRPFERDDEGRVVSEAGMVIIVTPLVEAEQALRDTESRCHSLFQSSAAGVLVFDPQFHFVDANPAVCRMFGYDKKALLRLGVLDVTASGARTEMHKLLRAMKSSQQTPKSLDVTFEHRNGGKLEMMVTPTCLRNGTGFHQGMLILTDISARKETEAALQRESELNRILIDNAPIATGLLTGEGAILKVNAVAEKLFGFTMKEVKGKKLWTLPIMGPEEVEASIQRFRALREGAAKRVEANIRMLTRSGEVRHVETSTTAVKKPDGSVDFFVTTGTDITERQKLEAEIIRVAEQEHIRIGHDLHDGVGQTLTGIASLVEALQDKLAGDNLKDAQRIRELVKTAIDETRRLSHGLSPAAIKNRGLAGGLMLIAETVRENFHRECVCHLEDPPPSVRQEVEIHLFRIAQEAVNNAIRHGGATKIRLSLRHKTATQGILEISDNGRGFPTDQNTPKSDGIGLRVMEHRANLINSELSVQTLKGRGVRVFCRFPLAHP